MKNADIIQVIQRCFSENRVLYTSHARNEMRFEEFGHIFEYEILEAVMNGTIVESYVDDTLYPSFLLYGETERARPLHVVFAYNKTDDMVIIITTYQPTKERWLDYKIRRRST